MEKGSISCVCACYLSSVECVTHFIVLKLDLPTSSAVEHQGTDKLLKADHPRNTHTDKIDINKTYTQP